MPVITLPPSNPQPLPPPQGGNIYIGARYVPIFYDDGTGSSEYNPAVGYEYLTIVTYKGNSYTSKTNVPAGITPDDTTYWVKTGDYNAQVAQYLQQVQAFDGRINKNSSDISQLQTDLNDLNTDYTAEFKNVNQAIQNEITNRTNADNSLTQNIQKLTNDLNNEVSDRTSADSTLQLNINSEVMQRTQADELINKNLNFLQSIVTLKNPVMVCIGDSYAAGGAFATTTWPTYLKNTLGIPNNQFFFRGTHGAGLLANTNIQKTASDLANTMSSADKSAVTHVIVQSGSNDIFLTKAQVIASRDNFFNAFNTIKNNFPNAEIFLVPTIMDNRSSTLSTNTIPAYIWAAYVEFAANAKIHIIPDCVELLAANWFNTMYSDRLHPNDTGEGYLAQHISFYLRNSNVLRYSEPSGGAIRSFNFVDSSSVSHPINFIYSVSRSLCWLEISMPQIPFQIGRDNYQTICPLSDCGYIRPMTTTIPARYYLSSKTFTAEAEITLSSEGIKLSPYGFETAGQTGSLNLYLMNARLIYPTFYSYQAKDE